jgi:chaperonin GroES
MTACGEARRGLETTDASGIIIPDVAKEERHRREILTTGPRARDETGRIQPLDLRVGDRVLFGNWSGTEVIIEGENRLIMKEPDIPGTLVKKKKMFVRGQEPHNR